MAQTIITSPFTENRMVISVTHTSHGFDSGDLGKPMRSSGVNGRFVVAQADSATNAEVVGVLTSVEDVNNYTITSTGIVDVAAAIPDAATAGQVLFVSQTADTVLTTTEPTAVGQVSKPVAVIIEQNAKMLLIHYRGEVITSTTQTNAPNDANYLVGTTNGDLSAEIVVGTSPGGELGGTWSSPTVDSTHSGSAHHAEAHTAASHSDTTATGANLNTLVGGGETALHSHASATQPSVSLHHSAAQNVSDSSTTAIAFDTENWKVGNSAQHSTSTNNSRLIAKVAGKYLVGGTASYSSNNNGWRYMEIAVNGTEKAFSSKQAVQGNLTRMNVTYLADLAVDDYVEFRAYQSGSGATLSINRTANEPNFWMTKVA